ncbi:prolyl oligopeptidase family serine peptidase [Gemmatimonadales bacterium]|nr:prolyl oligopeptidase family serine peptidase [Gemmatimonadales bacterium]
MMIRVLLVRFRLLTMVASAPLAIGVVTESAGAQSSAKRPLEIADYRLWRQIDGEQISDDGRWVTWSYAKVRMDDTLVVANIESGTRHKIARASDAVISSDGKWIGYMLSPPFLEIEEMERNDDEISYQAGLLNLESGESWVWDDAYDFGFSVNSSHFWLEKTQTQKGADHDGTGLILRNLAEDYEELIGSVWELAMNEDGTHLAYTVDGEESDGNGLYLIDLSNGARRGLDNSKARYSNLIWSNDGQSIAVLRGEVPDGYMERKNSLLTFSDIGAGRTPQRKEFGPQIDGLQNDWVLSEKDPMAFNEDSSILIIATKAQEEELEAWGEEGLPLADVNIWHWEDARIQSEQQSQLSQDQSQTYSAALHLQEGMLVHLADEQMRDIQITKDGRWGIGRDAQAYVSDWKPDYADYHRIDTGTGDRIPILAQQLRTLGLSPDSKHFLYWKDEHVWDYNIREDHHVNLTEHAPVDFTDQQFDRFGERPPYGLAGFTSDSSGIVLYDRYDAWYQPYNAEPAVNLTGNVGTQRGIRLRVVETDATAETINLSEAILFKAYGEWTKEEGFFQLDGGDLKELTWEARRFSYPLKATDEDRYLFTVQTWQDFPDLWVSNGNFSDRQRISTANPQQTEFLWGSRILFDYALSDGTPLQGTLAIPEAFTEGEKLPMVVRFYEKYSQDLHLYPTPIFRHQPNFAGLVSNGYLLMQPDVHFRIGSSHSDMLEAVEAATQKVIDMGYADPDAVGLSGHSYSGGGSAYIATRSKMFAAIAHGAAPINLVSEFNQLFVGSGQNNHSYDIYGQGRYATNPYDDFDLYWRESPISGVETMDTPVLYLHGESDPTVNWEQGLEWYNALRFLEKPVIWLSYPDEGHGLRKLQNRIDFQYRLQDFFGHHLLGQPAPGWMTDGVPQTDKERHLRDYAPQIFRPRLVG